jgi:hypothetical protein
MASGFGFRMQRENFLLVGGKAFLFDNNNPNRGFQSYIVFANDSGYIGKYKPVSNVKRKLRWQNPF